ncbi:MAG: NAD(P)-dependent oxidoreductase [Burkholderiales bacterium]|nr:NAD(P)-dependent oxidoreductase [Burkholderiales bacterium]
MHIALLGATSQIARDLIASFERESEHHLALFARQPEAVSVPQRLRDAAYCTVAPLADFDPRQIFDAIINFVGVGTPRKTVAMGASILEVTQRFDDLALAALHHNPRCRYLFLSSGAAYGSQFDQPADDSTPARFPINHLGAQDWYGIAKFYAECRHRALPEMHIVDLRVFNYFSRQQDVGAGYLITDIVKALKNGETLRTAPTPMVRDYIGPQDFHQLVQCLLAAPHCNVAVDCYSRQPIAKQELLTLMEQHFGLRYTVDDASVLNGTGAKPHYYSLSRRATQFGYEPLFSSADNVLKETRALLEK